MWNSGRSAWTSRVWMPRPANWPSASRAAARSICSAPSSASALIGLARPGHLLRCGYNAMESRRRTSGTSWNCYVRSLTKLQPHFITPWLFQSWNLSYNVSVESDRINDKYFYITRGIGLLAEGERQNRDNPDMRWSHRLLTRQHKIAQSDETNVLRSLFAAEHDPAQRARPGPFPVMRRRATGAESGGVRGFLQGASAAGAPAARGHAPREKLDQVRQFTLRARRGCGAVPGRQFPRAVAVGGHAVVVGWSLATEGGQNCGLSRITSRCCP